jgi:hypothetical protein
MNSLIVLRAGTMVRSLLVLPLHATVVFSFVFIEKKWLTKVTLF